MTHLLCLPFSTALHAVCLPDAGLWRRATERDFKAVLPHVRVSLQRPGPDDEARGDRPHVATYATAHQLQSLSTVAWTQPESTHELQAHSFAPREGSSLAQLTPGSVLVIGGWTNMGLANDVICMRKEEEQGGWWNIRLGADADSPRRVPCMEVSPCRVTGMSMPPRYGHSATAVRAVSPGSAPDAAPVPCVVVHGGMMSGGYTGEMDDTWLLYPDAASLVGCRFEPGWEASALWRWKRVGPPDRGPFPPSRGYHAACASPDGTRVYIFGGIAGQESVGDGWVLNTTDWTWARLLAGTPVVPDARFGASLLSVPASGAHTLWLFGGSDGADLLRDGDDKTDVWTLDTRTAEWKEVQPANEPPFPRNLGRCHSSVVVGTKVVFYGGSALTSRSLSWFDTQTLTFGAPRVAKCLARGLTDGSQSMLGYLERRNEGGASELVFGNRPTGAALPTTLFHDRLGAVPTSRLTHLAALLDGSRMLLTCGWQRSPYSRGCVNDVWLLDLAPARGTVARARPQQAEPGGGAVDDDGDPFEDEEEEEEDFGDDEEEEDFGDEEFPLDEEMLMAEMGPYMNEPHEGVLMFEGDDDDEDEDEMAEDPEEWADARVAPGDEDDASGSEEEAGGNGPAGEGPAAADKATAD